VCLAAVALLLASLWPIRSKINSVKFFEFYICNVKKKPKKQKREVEEEREAENIDFIFTIK
jgi:hypothetical protein